MERIDISRLRRNRSIYLKLGLVISLSLTVMAFNYTVYDQLEETYVAEEPEEDELVPVVRTVHKRKPPPPPPVFKMTDKIVEPDVIFEPEPKPIEPKVIVDPMIPEPKVIPIAPPPPPVVMPEPEPEPNVPPIWEVVEEMPRFSGCENQGLNDSDLKVCSDKQMLSFIYSNVKYPPLARENGIEGTVVASFVVEKDGSISGLKIVREIGGGCGKEVTRIIKKMPDWIAGEQRGRKVRVQFNLPVKFSLE